MRPRSLRAFRISGWPEQYPSSIFHLKARPWRERGKKGEAFVGDLLSSLGTLPWQPCNPVFLEDKLISGVLGASEESQMPRHGSASGTAVHGSCCTETSPPLPPPAFQCFSGFQAYPQLQGLLGMRQGQEHAPRDAGSCQQVDLGPKPGLQLLQLP